MNLFTYAGVRNSFRFNTDLKKRRLVGILMALVILLLFLVLNRIPKLDTVEADLAIATSPLAQCFQGFCIEQIEDSSLWERWWEFSVTYLNLVWIGMVFAFVMAGITEAFLFPSDTRERFVGRGFTGVIKGVIIGPAMNLCSACIVPIATAFRRRGASVEATVAITQGSSTMNLPALIMASMVFIPIIGGSRIALSILGALMLGPLVAWIVRDGREQRRLDTRGQGNMPDGVGWLDSLSTASLIFVRATFNQTIRLGPIMVIAGFISGLAIQWVSPDTVTTWIGDDVVGIVVAASLGIAINVPLMFEIPLVAAMLLAGMGTAPAGALLFTAAAGGPITFWGLAKVMPKKGVLTLCFSTWGLGIIGGIVVLAITAVTEEAREFAFKADYEGVQDSRPSGGQISVTEQQLLIENIDSDSLNDLIFSEATEAYGLEFQHVARAGQHMALGGGVVISDFDDDGMDDIYVINSNGPNALYSNQGDLGFPNIAKGKGVSDPEGWGNGGCSADFDNDGLRDLYVSNYGNGRLFHNKGLDGFVDISEIAGLRELDTSFRSMGCAWGDYDNDGLLDLVIVRHYHEWKPNLIDTMDFKDALRPMTLFHNEGGSRFEDVTYLLGEIELREDFRNGEPPGEVLGAGFQPMWVDIDLDGDQDLYVINDFGFMIQPNVLWRNGGAEANGRWKFQNISVESGADLRLFGMGGAVGDYDGDGDLDIYVTNIGRNVMLRNDGGGVKFSNVSVESRTGVPNVGSYLRVSWGAIFFDYDNDGDQDLYVVSGNLDGVANILSSGYQPNVLLRNEGDGTFVNVSKISGANNPGMGRGAGVIDIDDDGCMDLYIVNHDAPAALLKNGCGYGNHWLKVILRGNESNRDGIGSLITLFTDGKEQVRQLTAGMGFLGQGSTVVHFGMGRAVKVDKLSIRWPSGKLQELLDIAGDQIIVVQEP